ncbi:MAG: NAD(P)-dependent glycerol-3-phosphate dehydrogenase [Oscillospiraceae bacterium]|nr:NAD(P)-dependent glycerol-3-phosphate dehydrogenase [Oscillospiraceae bacterium]
MAEFRAAVLGCGFGTSLSIMLDKEGCDVTLWSPFEEEIAQIRRDGEHRKLLPGVPVPNSIALTTDLSAAAGRELIVLAVPAGVVCQTVRKLSPYLKGNEILVNVAKGLTSDGSERLSTAIRRETDNPVVVLSGPSHAEEVGRGIPTTVVVSSEDMNAAEKVQQMMMNRRFRIYLNDDLIGVELGGALKNVIALSAGISDGLKLGDNTKAALMTRGITEIARLGIGMGARGETFAGLTGIGDLIVTCTSMHSRNRRAGILIGEGVPAEEAVARVGTVEGYGAALAAHQLAGKVGIEMPITDEIYKVLYQGKNPEQTLYDLMTRPSRHETEDIWMG